MTQFSPSDLIFVPLGGSSEIGMNVNLYHFDSSWLMVDLGMSFPDDTMPGVNTVLPDLSFIEKRRKDLKGLVITHAHMDHIGAIQPLWEKIGCPIYGTKFAIEFIKSMFDSHKKMASIPMHVIDPGKSAEIGPFSVEMVQMTHSIPEPMALSIKCDAGTVLHTGDWKFDDDPVLGEVTDKARLTELGDEGVLALVGDSTNAMNEERTGSEADVAVGLEKVISEAEGRVAVACFGTNLARVQSIAEVANKLGKRVAVVGRALERSVKVAQEVGYLRELPKLVPPHDIRKVAAKNIVIICTGTQGEPNAVMARISEERHHHVHLEEGDTAVYSSSQIPGNEPAISRVQDKLVKLGIKVITDDMATVHVSGHPSRDELREMYAMVRPRIAVPVHGTARHLQAHEQLARSCNVAQTIIPSNGTVIKLASAEPKSDNEKAEIIDTVKTKMLMPHRGNQLIDIRGDMMRLRSDMLYNGITTASIAIDKDGMLRANPTVKQSGVCEKGDQATYIAEASRAVKDAIKQLDVSERQKSKTVEKVAADALKKATSLNYSHKPVIQVHVQRIEEVG